MKKLSKILIAASAVAFSTLGFAGWDKEDKELSLAANDLSKFEVSAGAGDLTIRGDKQADTIMVLAKIRGRNLSPDDYELYLRRHGERAYLYAHTHADDDKRAYIDLEVVVPSKLAMRIQDKSGDTVIDAIQADISVTDGSGDMEITEITGSVKLDDGSGGASIRTVTGDIRVKDGSGDLEIITVTGNVEVKDGSGDLEVNTVTGDLDISDNSGDVVVYTVTGEVSVDDSSGDIFVDTAEKFALRSDSSGDVKLKNVRSKS